jgi:hypothetical protein
MVSLALFLAAFGPLSTRYTIEQIEVSVLTKGGLSQIQTSSPTPIAHYTIKQIEVSVLTKGGLSQIQTSSPTPRPIYTIEQIEVSVLTRRGVYPKS